MSTEIKLKIIKRAIKAFGGKGKFKNIFNTASYQRIIQKEYKLDNSLSSKIAEKHLENDPKILRLYGGCHWILLN